MILANILSHKYLNLELFVFARIGRLIEATVGNLHGLFLARTAYQRGRVLLLVLKASTH